MRAVELAEKMGCFFSVNGFPTVLFKDMKDIGH